MEIEFAGAAREVTASCPLLRVHGEPEAQDAFAAQLVGAGYRSVDAPAPHQVVIV